MGTLTRSCCQTSRPVEVAVPSQASPTPHACCGGHQSHATSAKAEPVHTSAHLALTKLRPGQTARIHRADVDSADAALLRAMGLRPAAMVRVCRTGEPCIVEVIPPNLTTCACRIGLARPLADRVLCEPTTA